MDLEPEKLRDTASVGPVIVSETLLVPVNCLEILSAVAVIFSLIRRVPEKTLATASVGTLMLSPIVLVPIN
jgi:hypothetical protein